MAEYSKVYKKMWNNPSFRRLSEDARLLWLYLISCPHHNTIGYFILPKGYILDDLQWVPKRLGEPFRELSDRGWIFYDDANRLILIGSWFEHNKIDNPNQQKKALADLSELPKGMLMKKLADIIHKLPEGLHKGLINPLETVTETHSNSETVTEAVTVTEEEASSCRKNKFSDDDMACAKLLESEIRKNLPDLKKPNLESWANDIRLMRERDGRTYPEIQKRIRFAAADPFWKSNILSVKKLRKQYDQLTLKMQGHNQGEIGETDDEYAKRIQGLRK